MNRTQALNIIARTLQAGGGTFRNGFDITDELETGFVVGGKVATSVQPASSRHLALNTIANELIELSDNHDLIGTWLHEGEIHIDVVDILEDKEAALNLGKERGEIAIWDIANATEIMVQ